MVDQIISFSGKHLVLTFEAANSTLMSTIQVRLKTTLRELQQAQKVDRHLSELDTQIESAYSELDKLRLQLEKEFADIEKLEKLSMKALFHKVLGSKEQQLEKERQEYLQASLKYDEAKKSTELLEYEKEILEKKVQNLDALQARLDQLIKQRERDLVDQDTETGRQILELVLKMDNLDELIDQLDDAIKVGKQASDVLNKMIRQLQNAKNWGHWDMSGRKRGASYLKHSAVDRARDLSHHAKHLLMRFQNELKHIYGHHQVDLNLHFNSFSRFTDIFFDNLISDWIIQKKIQNALSNVMTVKDRVTRIMQSLEVDIQQNKDRINDLERQRKDLIIRS